jgi:FkbM family methyltransferase
MKILKNFINKILSIFKIRLVKTKTFERLIKSQNIKNNLNAIENIANEKSFKKSFLYFNNSTSQNNRIAIDIFVLNYLNFKKKGFFLEFGAGNGIYNSNTYLMEKKFEWRGILVEPAKVYYPELIRNRNCIVEKNCLWTESNLKLEFTEVDKTIESGMSTITKYEDRDRFSILRKKKNKKYFVNTITLLEVLDKYKAPKNIDFMSIDTEGSEFEILKNFNFKKYKFGFISCEHMWNLEKRSNIYKLLTNNGYKRIYTEYSVQDDWYVKR